MYAATADQPLFKQILNNEQPVIDTQYTKQTIRKSAHVKDDDSLVID